MMTVSVTGVIGALRICFELAVDEEP